MTLGSGGDFDLLALVVPTTFLDFFGDLLNSEGSSSLIGSIKFEILS